MQEASSRRNCGRAVLLVVALTWLGSAPLAADSEQTPTTARLDATAARSAAQRTPSDTDPLLAALPGDRVEEAVRQQTLQVPRTLVPSGPARSAQPRQDRQRENGRSEKANHAKGNQPPVVCKVRGTSRPDLHRRALAALPLDRLTPQNRARVRQLLAKHCLFRRLPTLSFPSDQRVYEYFASHPEVAVSIWHALNISEFRLKRVRPGVFKAGSSDGSSGFIEILYEAPGERLVLCHGQYKSPLLLKPVQASALLHLQASYDVDRSGQPVVTHHADVFVAFPSLTVETVARLIAPIGYLIADRNFYELSLFVSVMSAAMVRHPEAMEELAERLEGVTLVDRADLVALTRAVRNDSLRRSGEAAVVRVVSEGEDVEGPFPNAEARPSGQLRQAERPQTAPR